MERSLLGLVVQVSDEIAKIWSTSARRLISYGVQLLLAGCAEGHWIEIEYDEAGVLRETRPASSLLKTRRDRRGQLQVLDFVLLDPRRGEAFSESFGVMRMEEGREGGGGWADEEEAAGHCYQLWISVTADAQFEVEAQSLFRLFSRDSEYSGTYRRLAEQRQQELEARRPASCSRASGRGAREGEEEEEEPFVETVVVVGHDARSGRFFTASRAGEAFLPPSALHQLREQKVRIGDVFRALIERSIETSRNGVQWRVLQLRERLREAGEGVEIRVFKENDLSIDLPGRIIDLRATCAVLDTQPFGPVTYSLDRGFRAVAVGDCLLVRLRRIKDAANADHPSKWNVTKVLEVLPPPEEQKQQLQRGEWVEGIVTATSGDEVCISFARGHAWLSLRPDDPALPPGTVVDVRVRESDSDGGYEVCDVDERSRRQREDIWVERGEKGDGRGPFTVCCLAEVTERRDDDLLLLDTPIIGTACALADECPRAMRPGDVWSIRMQRRRRQQRDLPSCWVVHEVVGGAPVESTRARRLPGGSREYEEDEEDGRSAADLPAGRRGRDEEEECRRGSAAGWLEGRHEDRLGRRRDEEEEDRRGSEGTVSDHSYSTATTDREEGEWTTVIITGARPAADWYAACARADPVILPRHLVAGLALPKKGSFMRVKCVMRGTRRGDELCKAYEVDEQPVQLEPDFKVEQRTESSLMVWCYARVIGERVNASGEASFTLHNGILGQATLPRKFASSRIRVGDEIAALYYRVKTTTNPTHWMVQRMNVIGRR